MGQPEEHAPRIAESVNDVVPAFDRPIVVVAEGLADGEEADEQGHRDVGGEAAHEG
jgi:hypothetical protein